MARCRDLFVLSDFLVLFRKEPQTRIFTEFVAKSAFCGDQRPVVRS